MIPLSSRYDVAKRLSAALLLCALASPASQACRAPRSEQVVTPDEQLALASDVYVAKVIRESPLAPPSPGARQAMEYEFEVQQYIQGAPAQRFVLNGAKGETRPRQPSSDHTDAAFWQSGGGRLYNDADCVLRPDFVVGESYLIFLGLPATWRSFEHIDTVRGRPNPYDRWLSYVEARLGGGLQSTPGAFKPPVQP